MASSLRLKIYSPNSEYIGSCKYSEDAVLLANSYGAGATVRWSYGSHRTLWAKPEGDKPFDFDKVVAQVNDNAEKELARDLDRALKKLTGVK